MPDIAFIPSTVPELLETTTLLDNSQLDKLANPVWLLPLQEEWLALNEQLWHLPYAVMFHMVKAGFLPKKFLKLQTIRPPSLLCLFGQAHKKPWCYKSSTDENVSELCGPALSKQAKKLEPTNLSLINLGLSLRRKTI